MTSGRATERRPGVFARFFADLAPRLAHGPFPTAVLIVVALATALRVAVWPIIWVIDQFCPTWFPQSIDHASVPRMIALGLIAAPFLETALNQWLPFRIAKRVGIFPARPWLTVGISAILFGAMHCYSAGYMLSAGLVGWIFGVAYWLAGTGRRAFWVVCTAHAILNVIPMIRAIVRG